MTSLIGGWTSAAGPGRDPRGETVMSHAPTEVGADGLLIRPVAETGPAPAIAGRHISCEDAP